ncbi:MAG: ABC transporter permease subunit [Phycisphaerae bacterium]|nr:ABC transporter permease subunit [Phycisphaerae bacterium]
MLKALFWKEWHEQRWRMALACVWLLGVTAIGLKTRLVPDGVVLGMIAFSMGFVLPVFAGMGLFAEERHAKTLVFLQVQPVYRWQILLTKVGMGLLVFVVPYAVTFGLVLITVGARELPLGFLVIGFMALVGFSVIMYLWQILAGLGAKRPERYAALSAAVLGMWMIQGLLVDEFARGTAWETWIWTVNPFALAELLDAWEYRSAREVWTVTAVQGVIAAGLVWAVWFRFERLRERAS